METKQLSKYQIFWVFLQPIGGSATKSDLDKINKVVGAGRFYMCCDYIATFCPNQEKAKQVLNSLKSITKLSKIYKGFLISDAQFGRSELNGYWDVTTSKQKDEAITL